MGIPNRHDDAVRRWGLGVCILLILGSLPGVAAGGSVRTASVAVTTVVGPKSLRAPSGIALDARGDLFIADTNQCRILLVPAASGVLYGKHVRARQATVLAGTSCQSHRSLGYPTGIAVDGSGNVFMAEATGQRVLELHVHGSRALTTFAGTGVAGEGPSGVAARSSELDEPSGVAVDAADDLFIADSANCRIEMVPAHSTTYDGQAVTAGAMYTVAGSGVCGSANRGGSALTAQVWDPVAVAVDQGGDLFIADNGDQSVLEVPTRSGTYYGTTIGAGDLQTIVGMGMYGPYLIDGLSATSVASELNDPEGLAVSHDGTLFVTDGGMHCIRVVPLTTTSVFERTMTAGNLYTLAGALPISHKDQPAGDGTQWVVTHMGVPIGVAVSSSGSVYFSDRDDNQARVIR
jgi:trimeric autotransporter adhesin